MRILTWNMGCNIPASSYSKHHNEAWSYVLCVAVHNGLHGHGVVRRDCTRSSLQRILDERPAGRCGSDVGLP
jgi:hypothetical protein